MAPFTITFHNSSDVRKFTQDCTVPIHIEGRQKIDTKKWQLARYLLALADAGLLAYPLTVTHVEERQEAWSPDWLLDNPNGRRIGLEVTEASTNEFHQELIRNEKGIDNHYELRPGSVDYEQEHRWATLVYHTIRGKAAKLAKGNWVPAVAYDLAVYSNTPFFMLYPAQGYDLLHKAIAASPASGFRTVSVITTQGPLLFDVEGEFRTLTIEP